MLVFSTPMREREERKKWWFDFNERYILKCYLLSPGILTSNLWRFIKLRPEKSSLRTWTDLKNSFSLPPDRVQAQEEVLESFPDNSTSKSTCWLITTDRNKRILSAEKFGKSLWSASTNELATDATVVGWQKPEISKFAYERRCGADHFNNARVRVSTGPHHRLSRRLARDSRLARVVLADDGDGGVGDAWSWRARRLPRRRRARGMRVWSFARLPLFFEL